MPPWVPWASGWAHSYTLKQSQLHLEGSGSADRSPWGTSSFDGGTSSPSQLLSFLFHKHAIGPAWPNVQNRKKNVYGDLICFPFYYSFFQRPGTAEIEPRQGPGEQTGPGPGPGVMKWKIFTPQAALQCTCTNSMDVPTPPYQGPAASQSSFNGFTPCLARSILSMMKIRDKNIQNEAVWRENLTKRHSAPRLLDHSQSSLKT